MQRIIIDQPYSFVPPRFSPCLYRVLSWILPRQLRKDHGIRSIECVGTEKLRRSLEDGNGVILVPNHLRPCDPLVLDSLAKEVGRPFSVMSSWHVFMDSKFQRFVAPRIGAFSIYREGMDRGSLKCAIKTVIKGRFPLVIFGEGFITRSNDRLLNIREGPAFMARAAARARKDGKAIIHPVFLRYFFEGDLRKTLLPVVEEIEHRLSWQPQIHLPLGDRILKAGAALLGLKEIEYLGETRQGSFRERLQHLIDHLLIPMEVRWTNSRHDGDSMIRVKRLRTAILRGMIGGNISKVEREERWRQLADLYLVQQLHCYPGDYIEDATPERILETVERYEEDLTDVARPHYPLRAVITVGDAIEVTCKLKRPRENDPITAEIRESMEMMLESSKSCRKIEPTGTDLR
ncbi:1-acyl-sn-glycerol-3-phosphate acyltransferase [Haloferula chungangensis]|uniref:1-acyl-sn-glycerol-3-phosphate acyltransferase n=1 Tax=Haloferula chungangensis TaxID=1048331 RepID=A0ABW2L6A8_9BACT